MLKSYQVGGVGLLFNLGACLDKGLDSDLDQGLTITLISLLLSKLGSEMTTQNKVLNGPFRV